MDGDDEHLIHLNCVARVILFPATAFKWYCLYWSFSGEFDCET